MNKKRFAKVGLGVAVLGAISYAAVLFTMWKKQDDFIFYRPNEFTDLMEYRHDISRLELQMPDKTIVRGWHKKVENPLGVIMYFGGNSEDISFFVADDRVSSSYDIVSLNYRGFGLSDGVPSSQSMMSDSVTIHDFVDGQLYQGRLPITVAGRSMGTGVATWLTSQRSVHKTILLSPYDSFLSVASENYPWVPVRWLMRTEFNAMEWSKLIETPMVSFVGSLDDVVSPSRSEALFRNWKSPNKELVIIDGARHVLGRFDAFWLKFNEALGTSKN